MNIVLGSASPRRRDLIEKSFVNKITWMVADIDESYPDFIPVKDVAEYIATNKANALLETQFLENKLLITADTIVISQNKILGKPADEEEAKDFLRMLSGKKHEVITAVGIAHMGQCIIFKEHTDVYFQVLSLDDINTYVNNFKPLDKAGSYGIQEWIGLIGVSRIEGSYTNVMGLPTHRLYQELKKFNA
jgi:septum formation protein